MTILCWSSMALGALCLVNAVLWIPVLTEDVIECVLVLCGRYLCGASVFDTFSLTYLFKCTLKLSDV